MYTVRKFSCLCAQSRSQNKYKRCHRARREMNSCTTLFSIADSLRRLRFYSSNPLFEAFAKSKEMCWFMLCLLIRMLYRRTISIFLYLCFFLQMTRSPCPAAPRPTGRPRQDGGAAFWRKKDCLLTKYFYNSQMTNFFSSYENILL